MLPRPDRRLLAAPGARHSPSSRLLLVAQGACPGVKHGCLPRGLQPYPAPRTESAVSRRLPIASQSQRQPGTRLLAATGNRHTDIIVLVVPSASSRRLAVAWHTSPLLPAVVAYPAAAHPPAGQIASSPCLS